ncbi:hypothetical protein H8S90_12835 [Olivibacter sp. SDN3]|uniref:hypothetical protein n=1 Tax=Olivibacter sp. SDN3 TaxID=2764720 RepID=UPI001650E351|nr:hypothetical protein [Olivibacter sp. SDN3]QNL47712.1 hypothetical protein H8S90_12835 [Olivibacter sp. SDN3]
MKVYYIIPSRSKIQAMALWPVVLANKSIKNKQLSDRILLHEKIHHRQQIEMLVLPFYIWYVMEWLFKWAIYKKRHQAYKALSFEREAYSNDSQPNYLETRKTWNFIRFLCKK